MKEVVIVSGARTAVGKFGGALKGVRTIGSGAGDKGSLKARPA